MRAPIGTLLAVGLLFGSGITAWAAAASQPAADRPATTQVVILGTLHGAHTTNPNYTGKTLRDITLALKPAAVLIELPPAIGGRPTVVNGRAPKDWGSAEIIAANEVANALKVDVIPFDRANRNELYKETRYAARQQAASQRFFAWLDAQSRKEPKSVSVRTLKLLQDASGRQKQLDDKSGPEVINSASYDMLIATKHTLSQDLIPRVLAAAGEREVAGEFAFIRDEWQVRNDAMAENIVATARKFPGKRLVILTGSEHRYKLRDLLSKAPEVELKEFYDLPEGAASTRPAK